MKARKVEEPRLLGSLGSTMPTWDVAGRFYARRNYWQVFRKQCDAPSAAAAREWILSELGGCHHVKRTLVRIDEVREAPSA